MKLKKAGLITKIVFLVLIVYIALSLISLQGRITTAEAKKTELAETVKNISASNAALQYEIDHSTDPDTIESIARDKLGLVLPGETIYYDISD